MHAAELSRAAAALGRTSVLGLIRRADVLASGEQGEVIEAESGSVVAEMLAKHTGTAPQDIAIPAMDELLAAAAQARGRGAVPPTTSELEDTLRTIFEDAPAFEHYVCRLPLLSMPGCDMLRFEHLQALVRGGHGHSLRRLCVVVALGHVPAEVRPYL